MTGIRRQKKLYSRPMKPYDSERIAEENFPEIYDLLDRDFPFYQDSYVQIMTKELAEVIKNDAKIMARETQTEI